MSNTYAISNLVMACLISRVSLQIYLPCQILPVPGCTCFEPEAPIVTCERLNLTWIPRLSLTESSLRSLDLSRNQLTFLPSGVLAMLRRLRRLDLSHNMIKGIHKHALQGREGALEWFDLGHNKLSVVPSAFGRKGQGFGTWRLKYLGLAANRIHMLSEGAFLNMANLRVLDLDANPLVRIAVGAWTGLMELRTLSIGFRKMSRHSSGVYITSMLVENEIKQLEELRIAGSRPQFMGVIQLWLSAFRRLRRLELVSMRLTDNHLTNNSLSLLSPTLQSLSLRGNLLRRIPGEMLASLSCLSKLDLSGNSIRKFTDKSEDTQVPVQIAELDLSGNGLRKVRAEAIVRLRNATLIDLSSNNIRFIKFKPRLLESLGPHLHLKVGRNPLRCSCPNLGIRTLIGQEVSRDNGHLHRAEIFSSIRCGAGGKYSRQLVVNVPAWQFECQRRKPKVKHGGNRKEEQHILKKMSRIDTEPRFETPGDILNKHNANRFHKPITSFYYNRDIYSYLNSAANVNLPSEIAELLYKSKEESKS